MKNFIKLTSVMLFVCSPFFVISQTDLTKKDIDTRIDNWRYWQEKAEQGIIPFNPDLPLQPVIYYTPMPGAKSGGAIDGTDVLIVSGTGMSQSENSVFVNPIDNQIALNGNNAVFDIFSQSGANAMFTFDGGLTWTGGPNPITENGGDPAMAIDLDGNSFEGFIRGDDGQGVYISPDDGATWTTSNIANAPADVLLDKNHLWVDNSTASAFEGNLYSAWTPLRTAVGGTAPGLNEISFSRSTNGGVTWSGPIVISAAVAAGSHNQGVNIQTGPAGEIYLVWAIYDSWPSRETALGFSMSTDGGLTFSPAVRIISSIRGIRGTGIANVTGKSQRINSFPVMACDISGGPNNGDLYITWSNEGVPGTNVGPDVSVYMIRSTDGGTSWATPTRVNQDPIGNIQYFPWITSDPETGELHTIFYDDRDVGGAMVETWVASSSDGGATWTEMRVSDVAFTPAPIPGLAGQYMGDYLGIAARGGMVYPVWTDNRTGQTLSYTSPFECTCPNDRVITADVLSGSIDHRQAELTITASNTLFSLSQGVYHAGDEVLMTEGFTALSTAAYRAYIEGCTGTYILSPETDGVGIDDPEYVKAPKPKMVEYFDEKQLAIELTVFPNPTSDIFSVQLNDGALINNFDVRIYSMSQGLVSVSNFSDRNANSFQIDISDFAPGVYFIEVIDTENDKTYTSKVIKN
ncbi:MAG: hypothetical protein ACI8ZM_003535 [Crocinitomix sp.]|jgi:hypothetical protein